jgi:hypothetical protein
MIDSNPTATYPFLSPIIQRLSDIWLELTAMDHALFWMQYHGELTSEQVRGSWCTTLIYTGQHGRGINRPDLDRDTVRRLIHKLRELPDLLPRCYEIFRSVPQINYVGKSILGPMSQILPHVHNFTDNRILHVGLSIPCPGMAGLEVAGHRVHWQELGQRMCFDGGQVHAAWNDGNEPREVLHVDFTP